MKLLRLLWLMAAPFAVHAQFTFTTNFANGAITISGYTGPGGAVIIPSTTNGWPITAIGSGAFQHQATVTDITIPGSVTNIGYGAFFDCTGLTNVSMGSGVLSLSSGSGVFAEFGCFTFCTGLRSVILPASMTNIGINAFYSCTNLTNLAFSGGTINIGSNACEYTALQNISVPDSTSNLIIGNNAFASCPDLTNVAIGSGLSSLSIGLEAFVNCTNLLAFDVDPANSFFESSNGVLFDAGQNVLLAFPPGVGGTYAVPASVVDIQDSAFADCTSLTGVTFPSGITNIGIEAFVQCSSLTNMIIGSNVVSIGDGTFQGCSELKSIEVPDGVANIGANTFRSCVSLTNVVLGNDVTNIGDNAFGGCNSLPGIILDSNIVTIGSNAFVFCFDLSILFEGNTPGVSGGSLGNSGSVYYLPGTRGWSNTFGGSPAFLWNPEVQTGDGSFGVSTNGFGFNITGTTNIPVAVEAAAGLGGPWVTLQSAGLTNGVYYFSDPQWTSFPARFYRIAWP